MCKVFIQWQGEENRIPLYFTDLSPKLVIDIKDCLVTDLNNVKSKDIVVSLQGEILEDNVELITNALYIVFVYYATEHTNE